MSGRTSILGILRRRRAGLGRFVLAWFALAAASAGAAPCFAMTASSAPAAQHDHHAHDHSAPQAQPESPAQPSPCTHCPLAATMAGHTSTASHAFCSAADDASDGGKPSVPTTALKLVLSVPIVELLPFDPGPSLARDRQRPRDADVTSIALNLRHCVFLI
jgi:hypothetical protein